MSLISVGTNSGNQLLNFKQNMIKRVKDTVFFWANELRMNFSTKTQTLYERS